MGPWPVMAPPLLPITHLVQCSACSEHVRVQESQCPHCGARRTGEGSSLAAAAVAMGLALAGCTGANKADEKKSEPAKQAPVEVVEPLPARPEPIGPTAEYGVPMTRRGMEPDYGVPATNDTPPPEVEPEPPAKQPKPKPRR